MNTMSLGERDEIDNGPFKIHMWIRIIRRTVVPLAIYIEVVLEYSVFAVCPDNEKDREFMM